MLLELFLYYINIPAHNVHHQRQINKEKAKKKNIFLRVCLFGIWIDWLQYWVPALFPGKAPPTVRRLPPRHTWQDQWKNGVETAVSVLHIPLKQEVAGDVRGEKGRLKIPSVAPSELFIRGNIHPPGQYIRAAEGDYRKLILPKVENNRPIFTFPQTECLSKALPWEFIK